MRGFTPSAKSPVLYSTITHKQFKECARSHFNGNNFSIYGVSDIGCEGVSVSFEAWSLVHSALKLRRDTTIYCNAYPWQLSFNTYRY